MFCKNKEVLVYGIRFDDAKGEVSRTKFRCIVTNDKMGKTLSMDDGKVQYSIPFEPLENYLK
jgi:hypothetical protein